MRLGNSPGNANSHGIALKFGNFLRIANGMEILRAMPMGIRKSADIGNESWKFTRCRQWDLETLQALTMGWKSFGQCKWKLKTL
jgi:hypothetical protein